MKPEPVPLRVLVVEDSPDDADLLLRHLRRAGYVVDSVRVQTAEALSAAVAKGGWDVVLSDYSMPSFSAPEALALIKERGLDVPFIIVSGSVGEAAAVEAMKAGAHDFFLKDNLARLATAIERERREARVRHEHRHAIRELHESQERLREAVRARDEFLSIASHELKTPLTSLSLQVESAQQLLAATSTTDGFPTDKLVTKLASVSRQVTRLTTLINNLLDVSRVTSGHMGLAPDVFNLREAVESVVAALQDILVRSGSSLEVSVYSSAAGKWDRLRIESVIFNLLANAIKYGEGKPILVEVDALPQKARIAVTDRGIGIPLSEQERIFRRFERAVPAQHFGGFGLGLWLAREIIEAHGGTISVTSRPGAGSTFIVFLPLAPTGVA